MVDEDGDVSNKLAVTSILEVRGEDTFKPNTMSDALYGVLCAEYNASQLAAILSTYRRQVHLGSHCDLELIQVCA